MQCNADPAIVGFKGQDGDVDAQNMLRRLRLNFSTPTS
jgi:hypothetical protein